MRVGIFVVTPGRQGGGPETYEVQLIRALARVDKQNEYIVYCTHQGAINAIGVQQSNFRYKVLWPAIRWISIPVSLPLMASRDKIDLLHATMVPPPRAAKPLVLSILCSSNWTHPEYYEKRVVWRLNRLIACGLKSAAVLLCISKNLEDVVRDRFAIAPERLGVSYMGVGEEFNPRPVEESRRMLAEKYNLQSPYMLFIGQQQERKNVFRVIESYARFRAATNSNVRLALVGRNADTSGPVYEHLQRFNLLSHVQRIRYIPHSELPELYSAAEMLVFPSLWEGFGLPVIEAMACGTPVITSTVTCLPEIVGDAALVVDPESVEEISAAMICLASDLARRAELRRKGLERAKQFTWENCARSTLNVYERVVPGLKAPANAHSS